MSQNENKVPSAEEIARKHTEKMYLFKSTISVGELSDYRDAIIDSMREHTRLHLEAFNNGMKKKYSYCYSEEVFDLTLSDYLTKNKLDK